MKEAQSIESKEIRGVSLKTFYIVLGAVIMVTVSIVGSYYGLRDLIVDKNAALIEKINNIGSTVVTEKALNTMQLQLINRRLDALEKTK
jgi:hypothetical protein